MTARASELSAAATRDACAALDRADPLARLRAEFVVPDGIVYLDGNSLGALPRRTAARIAEVAEREWGEGLIRSWNSAGWIDLARRIGDKIAPLVGAKNGEVSVADSTSLNVFKTLSAAVMLQRADAPGRKAIVSERGNFPTDLYIAESVAATNVTEQLSDRLNEVGTAASEPALTCRNLPATGVERKIAGMSEIVLVDKTASLPALAEPEHLQLQHDCDDEIVIGME